MLRVTVAGASGYVGGELIRLIDGHPQLELVCATSERLTGRFLHQCHPHLRGTAPRKFVALSDIEPADVLILALPHGEAAQNIGHFAGVADRIIDCSADFRLSSPAAYRQAYGSEHPAPEWLARFVYGLPEACREELRGASYVSGVGCNATAANLALLPLHRSGLLDPDVKVVIDIKAASSESGKTASGSGQHAERSQVMRSYAPAGHRHGAEVQQVTGLQAVPMSVTAVDAVRGVLATAHIFLSEELDERGLWGIFRDTLADEPFVRIVHERRGSYRHPDPRTLRGTNFADVGWTLDPEGGRLVVMAAIDNLVKGSAGSAIQALNLMCGFDEAEGLSFRGIWP